MKAVFEKRIQLYKRYLKENGLTELDRIMLENKKQWQMRHLLGLIEPEESINRLSDLTEWIYKLEKAGTYGMFCLYIWPIFSPNGQA